MAVKFYTNTMNTPPYVEIKASPLKLLQGHNVYGFESIELGSDHMLGMLLEAFPQLAPILDLPNTEVLHLDTTYLFRLPHQNMVQPTLDYMANLALVTVKPVKLNTITTLLGVMMVQVLDLKPMANLKK